MLQFNLIERTHKMAKKRKKKENLVLVFSSIILGLAALILWFVLPALTYTILGSTNTLSFTKLAFGSKDVFKFSVLNFLPLLFIIISLLLSVLKIIEIKFVPLKLATFTSAVLLILACIFIFLTKEFAIPGNYLVKILLEKHTFTFGIYGSAIPALLGGLVLLVPLE